jgi:hypothetical protein
MASALGEVLAANHYSRPPDVKRQVRSALRWIQDFHSLHPSEIGNSPSLDAWMEVSRKNMDISSLLAIHISDSVLFITETQRVGITTGYVEVGDTVGLLVGSDRPVILRREEDHWRCIGSAYVYGIMKGEAWPRHRPVEDLESFVLL